MKAGEACAVVESVKTASDIYAPVSGTVTEINEAVIKESALVNSEPYGSGWFFKVRLSEPKEIEALLGAEEYGKLVNQ